MLVGTHHMFSNTTGHDKPGMKIVIVVAEVGDAVQYIGIVFVIRHTLAD